MDTLMNTNKLNEILTTARPNVKENTIKMYERNLNRLKAIFETDTWDFLDNVENVKKTLEELKGKDDVSPVNYTTVRNYYNSIIILLMALNSDKHYDTLLKSYGDLRDELNKKYEDANASGIISDKQKANFVPFKQVEDMILTICKELSDKNIKKKEDVNTKDKQLLQIYTLLNIYIRLPMRNDMAGVSAIMKSAYNKLTEEDKENNNYLVVQASNMWFVLNEYKTKAKYKEKRIDVPKDLEKILRLYIRVNGMGMLFKTKNGVPITRNALTQLLTKTSQKYMGLSISTTMLRKIVLSHKFQDTKEDMKQMADICGHSVATQQHIYVKKNQNENSGKSE